LLNASSFLFLKLSFKKQQKEEIVMALHLQELITRELSGENTGKIAALTGESNAGVTDSIGTASATIMGGLMNKAATPDGATEILTRITSSGYNGDFLNRFGDMLSSDRGADTLLESGKELLGCLFGSKLDELDKVFSSATGRAKGSSLSLLAIIAPVVMSILGKKVDADNLGSLGLMSLLNSQKSFVQSAAPSRLSGVLGLLSLSQLGGMPPSSPTGIPGNIPSFLKGLWPFFLILAALFLLINTCSSPSGQETPPATEAVATDTVTAPETAPAPLPADTSAVTSDALGAFGEYALPNGVKLNIPELGIERKLIAFIQDATKPADKETWFSFDRLVFDTGKSTLMATSQEQLNNIGEILKAYPAVELKIGGYTDNVGDPQANKKLSQARAETVMAELVKLGIDNIRLAAEGYGIEHPVADNATEEGRQQNRRVDCRVTKK
jgi:outer membrane protein OmpA-like peptidoglycan-associated protein